MQPNYCAFCGSRLPGNAAFCPVCGKAVSLPAEAAGEEPCDGPDIYAFLSPGDEAYRNKFGICGCTGLRASWNWAAFFFGWLWFGYRKMYIQAVCALLATLFVGPLPIIFTLLLAGGFNWDHFQVNSFAATVMLVSLFASPAPILCGVLANGLYLRDLSERMSVARSFRRDDPDRKKYIDANSGVNTLFVLIAILLVLVPIMAITFYYAYGSDPVWQTRFFLERHCPELFPYSGPVSAYMGF
ncbi:MAG: DUF2628 domain-containing protein [Abditibacteriota bacterium]|nr:DUF2628 domain-containing protein [Abditibacteriota bacterium]